MRIVSRNIAFVEGSYCNACSEQNSQAIARRNYSRDMVFVKELQIFTCICIFALTLLSLGNSSPRRPNNSIV
jgi:hypothetical protein